MNLDHETLEAMADEAGLPRPRRKEQHAMKTTTSGTPLAHVAFAQPPRHIPNEDGDVVKTELVLERSPERTVKVNWWWGIPDNVGGRGDPHSHPWPFDSTVLHGWIKERRYTPRGDGTYTVADLTHRAGETYFMDSNEFHVVTAVGHGTVTRMVCGEAVPGNEWGYLDPVSCEYTRAAMDPGFIEMLAKVNPPLVKGFSVEHVVPGGPTHRSDQVHTRSEAVDMARSLMAQDDLNAGVVVRVVRVSTGEIVWNGDLE